MRAVTYRVGIDVGGTFTDFTLLDQGTGTTHYYKCTSTPHDPSEAIEIGLRALLASLTLDPGGVSYLGHGTTVATNIVIERRGARTGLLTTRGFRDILELGRQARPSIYDYRVGKPPALIPRDRRFEVVERIGPTGEVLTELEEESLARAVRSLGASGVESIAICFLHAYRNPAHEERAKQVVSTLLPNVYVTLSSEIVPEFREFERMSTTTVNAFVGPKMALYIDQFRERMRSIGIPAQPYTMQSNGGLMSIESVRRAPVRTCVSGPAAGVVGAAEIGRVAGFSHLITFDVGGTSTDVSLIQNGEPLFTNQRLVAGYPVKTPMLDIHVIGAGGGSIALIDDAGAMKVGPQSAGAVPGPVAYGKGGTEPTITDANLVLGRLGRSALLGGRMDVDVDAARHAIQAKIADPLRIGLEAAAHGIIQIANANMSRAIRMVSVERGHDLSTFALCPFGGAGPLHAAEVAVECGIPQVLVPLEPGTLCARGMLLSDLSADYVRSCFAPADETSWRAALELVDMLEQEAKAWLDKEDIPGPQRRFRPVIDARYNGQNFEIKVDCRGLGRDNFSMFVERFHAAHVHEYGYAIPQRAIDLVNVRLQATGIVEKAPQPDVTGGGSFEAAKSDSRKVYIDQSRGWMETGIFQRSALPVGVDLTGPAIISEMSSTTLVLPQQTVRVDRFGNLIVKAA